MRVVLSEARAPSEQGGEKMETGMGAKMGIRKRRRLAYSLMKESCFSWPSRPTWTISGRSGWPPLRSKRKRSVFKKYNSIGLLREVDVFKKGPCSRKRYADSGIARFKTAPMEMQTQHLKILMNLRGPRETCEPR